MLTGAGFAPGEFVSVRVTHAVGIPDLGEGHGEWTVVADGDGGFVTTWHVCEDDCIGETLLATATGQTSGLSASVLFTDSAGSYTLKWYAADPEVNRAPFFPTYPKLEPVELPCPAPSGGSGIASNPLLNAYAYATPPIPSNLDAVTSLMPKDMALCQIAPFFVEITVTGSTAPENGIINFNPEWLTKTTSGKDFGFDPAYGVYCAFVDQAEPGTVDPEGDAKVLAYPPRPWAWARPTSAFAARSRSPVSTMVTRSSSRSGSSSSAPCLRTSTATCRPACSARTPG